MHLVERVAEKLGRLPPYPLLVEEEEKSSHALKNTRGGYEGKTLKM